MGEQEVNEEGEIEGESSERVSEGGWRTRRDGYHV